MTEYIPDRWAMVKFTHKGKDVYKILATFYGGYTTGDSWKLNSGCTKIEKDGEYYLFHGSSGSVYRCHRYAYGMGYYTCETYLRMKSEVEGLNDATITMHLMPETTNFMEIQYE